MPDTPLVELKAIERSTFNPLTFETENQFDISSPESVSSYFSNWSRFVVSPTSTFTTSGEYPSLNEQLHNACKTGARDTVKTLLERGVSPDCLIYSGKKTCTPLTTSVEANQGAITRLLVLEGADINGKVSITVDKREKLEYTALLAATATGNTSMIRLLLELGANIHETATRERGSTRTSATVLSLAAKLRLTEVFQLRDTTYITELKRINISYSGAQDPRIDTMFESMKHGCDSDLSRLVTNVADVNAVAFQGTALSLAAEYNQPQKIKLLLDHGANVQHLYIALWPPGYCKGARKVCLWKFSWPSERSNQVSATVSTPC
jgi:ankyrin repeat protein